MTPRPLLLLCALAAASCTSQPDTVPELIEASAERYLTTWQERDWDALYRMEGKPPEERLALHRSLTDDLAFYAISEVRYTDSAAACALTLRWSTPVGEYTETGELYLEREGLAWQVTGFKSY